MFELGSFSDEELLIFVCVCISISNEPEQQDEGTDRRLRLTEGEEEAALELPITEEEGGGKILVCNSVLAKYVIG